MLEIEAAREIVLNHAKPRLAERTDIATAGLGLTLAEDVTSDLDSPPFDKSMMDGYAIRSADCTNAGVELTFIEEIQAGSLPKKTVGSGECSRIFTGAPIPAGADAVVMVEKTETVSPTKIRINDPQIAKGRNILTRGREMCKGDVVISKGTILTPAAIGLLATVGKTVAQCIPQPRVAVMATGNEIVEPNNVPASGQIRNSNGPMLCALAKRSGANPQYLGIASDDEASLRATVQRGLESSDVLLITGGVSMGNYDLVPAVLESLGVSVHFHKVRMKPGKPLLFGTKDNVLVFGLPGNPVSGFVGYQLFVQPALRAIAGAVDAASPPIRLPIAESLSTTNDRPTYHPARIDGASVKPLPWFGSADLRGLLMANAFIVLPPGSVQYSAGQPVDVMAFGSE